MALPTALLVKGLAGVGAVAAVVGGGFLINSSIQSKNSNKAINEKIKALGISGCELENGETSKTCTLDTDKLKKVKFTKDATDLTATGENIRAELTIEKLGDDFKTDFPEGLRFTLKHNKDSDLDIGTDSNKKITLKKNIDYDFKIKTADDKSLKLEKAWDLTSLIQKVGLSCTGGESADCCTTGTSINVWKGKTNYKLGATVETGKKMSLTKDSEGYLEGFKFTVGEESDINLTGGTDVGATIDKLTKNNKAYEIDLKDDNGTKKWFLVEKTTS